MPEKFQTILANSPSVDELQQTPTLLPFHLDLIHFVDSFSRALMQMPQARSFPEMMALAFWMRKANIMRLRDSVLTEQRFFMARGTVFHIAPANVDTIFIYSWFLSLLCGNRNIVRISAKTADHTSILLKVIQELLGQPEFQEIARRSLLVHYGHDAEVNRFFSGLCDLRVIWGGDESILRIRQAPLSATACEMTFADKFSLCLIDAKHVAQADEASLENWAKAFYNDAYWFAQMACSSPRLVLWVNQEKKDLTKARQRFWEALERHVIQKNPSLEWMDYMNKRVASDSLAIDAEVTIPATASNALMRVWLETPALHVERHCGAGLFFESEMASLQEMTPLLSRKIQTVSYLGFSPKELGAFLQTFSLAGIDRFVPIGQALEFQPVWDGYDLFKFFLREVVLC